MRVYKAQPIGEHEVEDLNIQGADPFPVFETLEGASVMFRFEATALERALHDSLPGGTYSELLRAMLLRKASHFVVSFADPPKEK